MMPLASVNEAHKLGDRLSVLKAQRSRVASSNYSRAALTVYQHDGQLDGKEGFPIAISRTVAIEFLDEQIKRVIDMLAALGVKP